MVQNTDTDGRRYGWDSVDNWYGRLKPSTAYTAGSIFNMWMEWLGEEGGKFSDFTPDSLVEYQKRAVNDERYDIVDLLQRFVLGKHGRLGYKKKLYSFVRSFFMHNRADLPRDKSFKIRGDVAKVVGTLSADEIKLVILSSNRVYAAAFLCMFQAGLDQDMFIYWNENGWKKLREDLPKVENLRPENRAIKIDLPGRKNMKFEKPYYSFIGHDAIELIKNWLPHRPETDGDGKPVTAIFTQYRGKPLMKGGLKTYWRRHCRKLGLMPPVRARADNNGRAMSGKGLHEMRDVFKSLWSKSPSKYEVSEFFLGHRVDPLEYDKSFRDVEFYRQQYLGAAPWLNLMSSGRAFKQVAETEVDLLRDQLKRVQEELQEERDKTKDSETRITTLQESYANIINKMAVLMDQQGKMQKEISKLKDQI